MSFDFKKHQIDIGIYSGLGLLTLIGVFLLYTSFPRDLNSGTVTAVDPNKHIGVVRQVKNDVRWKPGGEINWTDLFSDHGIDYEDQLYVGQGSGAVIESKGLRAQVLENTLFTFTQRKDEMAFVFQKGSMEIEMQESQPIALEVGTQTIRMKGNSKVLIQRSFPGAGDSRDQDKEAVAPENIGVSILSGKAKMITPSGRVVPTQEGQAFAILPAVDSKGPKFKSMHIQVEESEKNKVFFANEKLDLGWNAKARKFKSIDVQISTEKDFSKIVLDKKADGEKVDVPALAPGKYYWRVKGDTGLAQVYGPVSTINVVTDITPKQHAPEVKFSKPGEWDVKLKAIPVEVADRFEFQVSADESFQKIISQKESTNYAESLPVQKEGEVFTRVRFKYKGRDRYSPWSLPQTADTPTFVDAPMLSLVEPRSGTDYQLKWTSIKDAQFYQIFQTTLDSSKNNKVRSVVSSAKIRALTRTPSEVFVRGHKSEKEFGFNSNIVQLKGFVDRPRIKNHNILPRWLPRFHENSLATLELKIEAGLQEEEVLQVEVAATEDFKEAEIFETTSGDIRREVPVWNDYYIRSKIKVDDAKYFTYYSEVAKNFYPDIAKLRSPDLKFPRNHENIVILTQNPFVIFSWIPFDDDVQYDLELSMDRDFKSVVYKSIVSGKEMRLPKKLNSGDYFWRMRSFSKIAESPWSETFSVSILNGK